MFRERPELFLGFGSAGYMNIKIYIYIEVQERCARSTRAVNQLYKALEAYGPLPNGQELSSHRSLLVLSISLV